MRLGQCPSIWSFFYKASFSTWDSVNIINSYHIGVMLGVGWATFIVSYLINVAYYVVHPSGIDLNPSRFKNRLFVYVLGQKKYLPWGEDGSEFDDGSKDEDANDGDIENIFHDDNSFEVHQEPTNHVMGERSSDGLNYKGTSINDQIFLN